jgi:hypothetical protein
VASLLFSTQASLPHNNINNNNNNHNNNVIIEATGTISKSLKKYLSNIGGKDNIKELKKTAIQGTAHTHTHTHSLQKVQM